MELIIEEAINAALLKKSHEASSIFVDPKNSRSYRCSQVNCERLAYAKGLCNGHYIRNAKGLDMGSPLRARKREGLCSICKSSCGSKGGWGLCPKHYTNARYAAIKDACIEALGGKCKKCDVVYHRSVYDFHHVGKKDASPSHLLSNASAKVIAKELSRCVLLCSNCHRLEHFNNEI